MKSRLRLTITVSAFLYIVFTACNPNIGADSATMNEKGFEELTLNKDFGFETFKSEGVNSENSDEYRFIYSVTDYGKNLLGLFNIGESGIKVKTENATKRLEIRDSPIYIRFKGDDDDESQAINYCNESEGIRVIGNTLVIIGGNGPDQIILGQRFVDTTTYFKIYMNGQYHDVSKTGVERVFIHGNNGPDYIDLEHGNFNTLAGNPLQILLNGGNGPDHIKGSYWDDVLYGGNGPDLLHAFWSQDNDYAFGGQSSDTFYETENIDQGGPKENCDFSGDIFAVDTDTDNDGIEDSIDQWPNDPLLATYNCEPSCSTMGTIMFEDMWPQTGDYDFNDLVVNYRTKFNKNADGDIKEIEFIYKVDAIGGIKSSSIYLRILDNLFTPLLNTQVESVSGANLSHGFADVSANGTENGTTEAIIPILDNTRNAFSGYGANDLINVLDGQNYVSADTDTVKITFETAVATVEIDVFLVTDFDRSKEIHLTNYGPTSKANQELFGTGEDSTVIGNGYYYKTQNGYPWALNIADEIAYPKENRDFSLTYTNFGEWAENSGSINTDWYVQIPSNYVQSRLFQKE
jgi:LruC domain-containing protein